MLPVCHAHALWQGPASLDDIAAQLWLDESANRCAVELADLEPGHETYGELKVSAGGKAVLIGLRDENRERTGWPQFR